MNGLVLRKYNRFLPKYLGALIIILCNVLVARASHVPGGNITYECLGNGQYVITLTLFEDCGTAFESNSSQTVQIANDCGYTSPSSQTLTNVEFQTEVSQLCQSQIGLSECNGGTLPGVYMHVWRDTITLPAGCDSWTFSYSSCCRNESANLVGSSDNYYWEAVLNNNIAPCNTAPTITAQPIPYVCVNQLVTYNLGAYEPDGNTLVYSLIDAMTGSTGIVTYDVGFSGASPIPGITVDPVTGEIQFTPSLVGNYVVAILVEEYDDNGNFIGSIIQDFQFEVISCAGNDNPAPPVSGISNYTGDGAQTGPTSIEVCEGDNMCFQVEFTDPNGTDSIYLSSNSDLVLAGATFTQLSFIGTAVAEICWTAVPGANPFSTVTINAQDNSCPIVGVSTMSIGVTVVNSTYAGADETICLGNDVQLNATGGSNFVWSVISGDPISPGNFSCTNCQNPIAGPATTTVYEVVSNLAGGCTNTDTITVSVVPDFTYSLTQSSTSSCLNSEINLNIVPSPAGAYTYSWSPATFMDDPTIANPTLLPTSPGSYQYAVEIISSDGCVKNDTINVDVVASYAPNVTVTTNATNIWCGDTVFFETDLGCGVPSQNGLSVNNVLCGAPVTQSVGVYCGENTTTSWPAPYGNYYRNAKQQYLFLASELQAMGLSGGEISAIAWDITQVNGTTAYNSFTLKMGATTTSNLTNWEPGLVTVFNPQTVNIALGVNTHVLSTPFLWDGISNLVIETCYDNLATSYTQNSITPYDCTLFNSVLYYRSDATAACPYTGLPTTSVNRPITTFTMAPVAPDPSNYTFAWPATSDVNDVTAQNTFALPNVTTDYQLVVTDINGGCTDTVLVHIDVICDTCVSPIPTLTHITCNGGNDGGITAQPSGIDGPPWILELIDGATGTVLQTDLNVTTVVNYTGLSAGTYIVKSTDTTGCYADTLVELLEPTAVSLSLSPDTTICIGGQANLTVQASDGNGGGYTYFWEGIPGSATVQSVSPASDTSYTVYALDALGCSSDTLSVGVSLFPEISTISTMVDSVCPGDFSNIAVTASGGEGAPYSYNWLNAQGMSVGATSSVSVLPVNDGDYFVVEVQDGCETPTARDTVYVYWYPEPDVTLIADITEDCYPVQTEFTNTTQPSMVASCLWDFGDGSTSTTCGQVSNYYSSPGVYSVSLTVTSPEGCVADTTIVNMITAYGYPMANFGATPNPADVMNPTVQFTDSSLGNVVSYQWEFGDNGELGSDVVNNPVFIFPDDAPGTYPVELTVYNAFGCSDSIVINVVINGVYNFYVPNTFTPDGDGVNDYFFPIGEGLDVTNYALTIFNRWGGIVYSSDDYSNGRWDGTYLNLPSEQGVYVWRILTKNSITGEVMDYRGQVNLLR